VRVGLCAERSLEMVVGLLGILKAGGAYIPLDPIYPKERLAFMLSDAQAPVLVTQESLRARLPVQAAQVICLDADWRRLERRIARRRQWSWRRQPGVCDLYLRFHRKTKGGSWPPSRRRESILLDVAGVSLSRLRSLLPKNLAQLGRLGLGDLRPSTAGSTPGTHS